ncbi:MAG: 2-C-methyl-D-erythritol 2,4-cyclodiphosphate synthase [Spirochaetota bacterium]|nr:2-C-methyl-D-erythritol 2,4-cyclodiphosphate synthase [Spirochaetota bacterium]
MRIGNGFDVHRFVQNRKLILGGVEIPYEYGLEGHSDADVLCHAIADSLLGALSLGDIGKFFPDTDAKYKGMDSLILLKEVYSKVKSLHYAIVNVDTTIICQKPKLAQYIDNMKSNIARVLDVYDDSIGIKATTTEGLGFTGRAEGIAVIANVLIQKVLQ